jgi:hypothetical protein
VTSWPCPPRPHRLQPGHHANLGISGAAGHGIAPGGPLLTHCPCPRCWSQSRRTCAQERTRSRRRPGLGVLPTFVRG